MNKKIRPIHHLVFLGPSCLIFALIVAAPFFVSLFYSLTDWNGISRDMNFVGLQNYLSVFSRDTRFFQSFSFTIKISIVIVSLTNVIGIALAALLTNRFRGSSLFRAIFFLPNTMGGVVMGYIWRFIFLLVVQQLGNIFSWSVFSLPWLGTEGTAFTALVIVSVWQGVGYVMVIMIAALSGVPQELIEVAKIDGASAWRTFWQVKIPICMPYITVCLFWTISSTLKMFDVNVALTKGGPYGSSTSLALQIYNDAFTGNSYGRASAEATIFFILIFSITMLQLTLTRRKEKQYQ